MDSWGAPPDLRSMQTFQEHLVTYLCPQHRDYSMFDLVRGLPYTSLSQVWSLRMESWDVHGDD